MSTAACFQTLTVCVPPLGWKTKFHAYIKQRVKSYLCSRYFIFIAKKTSLNISKQWIILCSSDVSLSQLHMMKVKIRVHMSAKVQRLTSNEYSVWMLKDPGYCLGGGALRGFCSTKISSILHLVIQQDNLTLPSIFILSFFPPSLFRFSIVFPCWILPSYHVS
jgi:hypothetical protein